MKHREKRRSIRENQEKVKKDHYRRRHIREEKYQQEIEALEIQTKADNYRKRMQDAG